MSGVVEFLLARLADEEATANDSLTGDDLGESRTFYSAEGASRDGWGLWTHHVDPARVLADVAAKRRIVENCVAASEAANAAPMQERLAAKDGHAAAYWRGQDWVLRALATAYSSHPDYDKAWQP